MYEEGTMTVCQIPCLVEPDNINIDDEFDFKLHPAIGTLDIESKYIRYMFNELDINQSLINIQFNQHKPRLVMTATGNGMGMYCNLLHYIVYSCVT